MAMLRAFLLQSLSLAKKPSAVRYGRMSFVEHDDYEAVLESVLELARRSDSVGFTRKCGFTVE